MTLIGRAPPRTLWSAAAPRRRGAVIAASALGIAIVGWVDYVTGIEIRLFPFYYAPIGLAAWHLGRIGSIPAGLASAGTWLLANALGGLQYSDPLIWAVNTTMQAVSFLLVGGLIALLRERLVAEQLHAGSDALTGLMNRRAFYEAGSRVVARCQRTGTPATLAYIDLDHFKAVNDTEGHAAGDQVLRDVASFMRLAVRPADLVARLGGDEFAILLTEAGVGDARMALERVRVAVERAFSQTRVRVTCSIGAVWFRDPPDDLDTMVRRADPYLYASKNAGRNQVTLETATPSEAGSPESPGLSR